MAWGAQMPKSIDNDRELRTAIKAPRTPDGDAKIASYLNSKANSLDAQATGYEQAAATARQTPGTKNQMSPTTAGRYEYMAKQCREQANSNRTLAASYEPNVKGTAFASQ